MRNTCSMIAWMKNLFTGMASYVPVINKFVSNENLDKREVNQENKRSEASQIHDEFNRAKLFTSSRTAKQKETKRLLEQKSTVLNQHVKNFPYKIFQNNLESERIATSIKSHIKKIDNNIGSSINFNETYLVKEIKNIHNHLTNNFRDTISTYSSGRDLQETEEKYIALIKQYIQESIRLALETENLILSRLQEDSIQGRDIDIAQGLTVSRNISKTIMDNAMNAYLRYVNNSELPSAQYKETIDQLALRNKINAKLKPNIKILHLASQFGIHNKDTVNKFIDHMRNLDFKDDIKLSNSLATILELQNAIQGSVNQDINNLEVTDIELGEIDNEIIKECFDDLLDSVIKEFELGNSDKNRSEEREIYYYKTRDLSKFLTQISMKEIEVYKKVQEMSKDKIWRKLDFNPKQEASTVNQIYQELNKTAHFLGVITDPNLPNGEYANPTLLVLKDSNIFNRHFRRTLLEAKLLAGIDAIQTHRKNTDRDLSFCSEHPNFKSLPWLKDFYQKSYEEYLNMIENDISIEKTMNVANELGLLGHALHKIGLFASDNFFKRYGVQEYAEKMLEKMGELTEVGVIAVMIDLYSHLFSYLSPNDKESSFMEAADIGRLKRLIKYLKQLSTIKDPDTGEILMNPKRPNQHAIHKYDEMAKVIGSKGFLLAETDLVLDFFNKAIKEETKKKLSNTKYSLLDAKHTILATWLLYIIVKFLPKKSDDIESLKARVKVMKTLLNDKLQPNREIPSTLYPKINGNLMGYKNKVDSQDKQRLGIISEICNEVESKIQDHIAGKGSSIALKDLLYVYEDLENVFKNNPNGTKKALQVKEKNFNNKEFFLRGLSSICTEAFETNPALIVQFTKTSKNQDIKLKLANQILQKIEEIIDDLNLNNQNELHILDSDQEKISSFTKLLIFSQYLGFLMNKNDAKTINLRPETMTEDLKDDITRTQAEQRIQKLNKTLNAKILLEQDERYSETEDAFPEGGQFRAKNLLLELLSKPGFTMQPSLGKRFEWLKPKQITRLRENQVSYSFAA
jgi:ribosomal protein S15P/S13E